MNTYLHTYLPTKTLLETGTKILTTSYQRAINRMHFVCKNIFEHNGKCHTISDHVRRICLKSLEDNKLLVIVSSGNMINTQCTCTKYDYTLFVHYMTIHYSYTIHIHSSGGLDLHSLKWRCEWSHTHMTVRRRGVSVHSKLIC